MSLASTISRLSRTANRIADKFGTDEVFVLARRRAADGRGATVKAYAPTTRAPFRCFYSVLDSAPEKLEVIRAERRAPVLFRRFVLRSDAAVTHENRLRLVARGDVPQIEMEIVRVAPLSGLLVEVIAVEELKAGAQ